MFYHKRHGTVDVISVRGPFNVDVIENAKAFVEPWLNRGIPKIVLDLEGVQLIDSAGLEFLLELQDRCLHKSGEVQLAGAAGLCRDALCITGVADRFETFTDVTSAVGSFSR